MMKLFINGKEAVKGQQVTTFRGEKMILTGWREPQHAGSTGRVYVSKDNNDRFGREFFPSVIDGEFKEGVSMEYPLYKLTLCKGEDDEEIVYANLTRHDEQTIRESISGIYDAGYVIKTTDNRYFDVGIIDEMELVRR